MNIKEAGETFIQGLLLQYAPDVAKGMLSEWLATLDFRETVKWVAEDRSLIKELPEKWKRMLRNNVSRLNKLDFLSADWMIDAGRETNPLVASYFIGDPAAKEWLERQANDIREEINDGTANIS